MASKLLGFLQRSLKSRPVVTNTLVYATFYTAAELSQQSFNKYYSPEKPDLNFTAAIRIATVGSCIYAPTLYFWYKFLDRKFVGKAAKAVFTKVGADQFLMTPVLLAAFYSVLGYLEHPEDAFKELKEKYFKTFVANQFFWCPAQTVNFYYVPPHLRVVYVASTSFVWINVLVFIKRQKVQEVKED